PREALRLPRAADVRAERDRARRQGRERRDRLRLDRPPGARPAERRRPAVLRRRRGRGRRARPRALPDRPSRRLRGPGARPRPAGARVSADLFGLAATRDIGIGQVPRRLAGTLDTIYPMAYPSHFGAGEYQITDPGAFPGRTVANALLDFRRAVRGRSRLVPWLQDFSLGRAYGLIEVTDEIAAARRQHAAGFMLWNPEGVYTQDALAAAG